MRGVPPGKKGILVWLPPHCSRLKTPPPNWSEWLFELVECKGGRRAPLGNSHGRCPAICFFVWLVEFKGNTSHKKRRRRAPLGWEALPHPGPGRRRQLAPGPLWAAQRHRPGTRRATSNPSSSMQEDALARGSGRGVPRPREGTKTNTQPLHQKEQLQHQKEARKDRFVFSGLRHTPMENRSGP